MKTKQNERTKTCILCQKIFIVEFGKRGRKYCSFECSCKDRNRKGWHIYDKRICLNCKEEFSTISWRKKKKFCCFQCSCLYRRGKPNGRAMPESKLKRKRVARTVVDNGRQILVHRLLMEKKLKRQLTSQERVHHINCDISDNRIENLYLFPNINQHQRAHRRFDKLIKPLLEARIVIFENGRYSLAVAIFTAENMEGK